MRDLAALTIHLLVTIARLLGPGGARSVVDESLLVKHQLLILNRSRTRAPALHPADRIFAGLVSILMIPARLMRSAIVLKPSTILRFHKALVKRKYRLLFTSINRSKPGLQRTLSRAGFSHCQHETKKSRIRVSTYRQSNFTHLQYSCR